MGKINGTDSEVVIINPTTIGNLPPRKFTTKGDPSPVDIPDNKNIDNIRFVLIGNTVSDNRFIIANNPTGINTSFTIVRIINFFGW